MKYIFNLPEELTLTPEAEARFTKVAESVNMTQEQADDLIQLHSELMLDMMARTREESASAGLAEGPQSVPV